VVDQQRGQGSADNGQTSNCRDDLIATASSLFLLEPTLLLALVLFARDLAFPLVAA
jgi:hypothetical protein